MASVLRPPGVRIERFAVDQPVRPARVDVPVLVAVTERGPLHVPTRVASWPEFVARFGGFVANGFGAAAAKALFDNGGEVCWVVRVAAPERATTTTGPQPADRRSSVLGDPAGLVDGAVATLEQGSLRRTHLVTAVDGATASVTWDRALDDGFDLTAPLEVRTGAAPAGTVLHGTGGAALRIVAAGPGAWGNRLTVTVAPARPAVTVNRPEQPSSATVVVVRSTVGFAPGMRVVVSQEAGGVVTTVGRTVAAVDPRAATLTWDLGLPATIDRTATIRIRTEPFTIVVAEGAAVREVFPDLDAGPGAPRSVVDVLAGSGWVRATAIVAEAPLPGTSRLGGGRDGTAALAVADLLGDDLLAAAGDPAGMAGLAATVELPEPALVLVPDLVAPDVPAVQLDRPDPHGDPCAPCPPPAASPEPVDVAFGEGRRTFAADVVLAAQQRIIEHCERHTERFAVLDAVGGHSAVGAGTLAEQARRLPSGYAALVAPWIRVVDPRAGARGMLAVPASAHYAGLIARTDLARGPWAAPANQTLDWAHGTTGRFTDEHLAVLNEAGVVAVRPVPGVGLAPMGVRTTSADPLWRFVTVRRAMIGLRRTLRLALAWTAFEPAGVGLVSLVAVQLDELLHDLWADGGLAGRDPAEAYFVHVEDPASTPAGEFTCTVGVALARPAEFVVVQVRRTAERLELTEPPERRDWP